MILSTCYRAEKIEVQGYRLFPKMPQPVQSSPRAELKSCISKHPCFSHRPPSQVATVSEKQGNKNSKGNLTEIR